ncbi:putative DNA/RNA nuclease [Mycoplasmopsis canis UF33]|nr:putative DNA/RNA nuclease [Mycoplasmopsis canis UF33]
MMLNFKKILSFCFFVTIIFLNTSCSYLNSNNISLIKVIKVIDGDTIKVLNKDNNTEIIRLYGIDAPETLKERYNEDSLAPKENFYAQISKKYLLNKIKEANFELYVKKITYDKYRRSVSILFTDKSFKESLNIKMIKEGLARVAFIQGENPKKPYYTTTDYQFNFYKKLIENERVAKVLNKGFWKYSENLIFFKKL